ncbi:MAG: hypothetical protein ACE5LB_14990 [Acidiferrobacterales bacterium]
MQYFLPGNFLNVHLRWASGPQGADDADMVVNASTNDPSVFEWVNSKALPGNIEIIHFAMSDPQWAWDKFGALQPLANGLKLEMYDTDGATLLHDFFDGFPAQATRDFLHLSKHIPFSDSLELHLDWRISSLIDGQIAVLPNQIVRCTIEDNLSGIQAFGISLQGYHQ